MAMLLALTLLARSFVGNPVPCPYRVRPPAPHMCTLPASTLAVGLLTDTVAGMHSPRGLLRSRRPREDHGGEAIQTASRMGVKARPLACAVQSMLLPVVEAAFVRAD